MGDVGQGLASEHGTIDGAQGLELLEVPFPFPFCPPTLGHVAGDAEHDLTAAGAVTEYVAVLQQTSPPGVGLDLEQA